MNYCLCCGEPLHRISSAFPMVCSDCGGPAEEGMAEHLWEQQREWEEREAQEMFNEGGR